MIHLHRTHLQPIALDIGQSHVRMLQLEVSGGELSVVAALQEPVGAETPLEGPERIEALRPMLRRMLRKGGFRGRRTVAMLPRTLVRVKTVRLPPMPPSELDSAVPLELPHLFGDELDELMVRYLPTGQVRQGSETRQELIVVAASQKEVGRYVEQLHQCGFHLESLDFEPCALLRGIERFIRRKEDESEVQVLVEIGWSRSCVVISKGRDITFYKTIEIGGRQMDTAVAGKLGLTLEQASALRRRLAESGHAPVRSEPVRQTVYDAVRGPVEDLGREISLCLRYYSVMFRGQRPARMRLFGGEACDMHLQKMLSGGMPMPVETGRPLYSVDRSRMDSDQRRGPMSQWATAMGLALRLTAGPFKPRDGKPRDPNEAWEEDGHAGVEVPLIDELAAMDANNDVMDAPRMEGSLLEESHERKEAVHA